MSDDMNPAEQFPPTEMRLPHRDDVAMEQVLALEQALGSRVVFAGDVPDEERTDEMREAAAKVEEELSRRFLEGQCISCEAIVPAVWPPEEDDGEGDDPIFELPEGWIFMFDKLEGSEDEMPMAFMCPKCDAATGDDVMICKLTPKES